LKLSGVTYWSSAVVVWSSSVMCRFLNELRMALKTSNWRPELQAGLLGMIAVLTVVVIFE